QSFVAQVYQDLLGRAVDAVGFTAWTDLLDRTGSRERVVEGIQTSLEYRMKQVREAYLAVLHREVDPSGLKSFVSVLSSGSTPGQMRAQLFGSAEYLAQAGGTADGFLGALYRDELGRDLGPTGAAAWHAALANGGSREAVALGVL